MGRLKVSIAKKKIQGTYRQDRQTFSSLEPAKPKMPPFGLTKDAKKYYHVIANRLEQVGTLSKCDELSLVLMSESYSTFIRASKFLEENGETYQFVNKAGDLIIRPRPEVAILRDSWNRVFRLFKEYGLTNASRANIMIPEPRESDKWDD